MPKVIYYQPVYKMLCGKKDILGSYCAFNVNGAISKDKDEAIRLGNKHVDVIDGRAKLLRVDEWYSWED